MVHLSFEFQNLKKLRHEYLNMRKSGYLGLQMQEMLVFAGEIYLVCCGFA